MDRLYGALMEAIEHGTLQTHLETAPVVDLDAGMQHLASLVELLPDAPAYPIDAFATIVDLLAPTLRDHPLYRQVCDGLDRAVARQEGDTVAGDRCRQRAEALQQAGRLLDALREFHQAKINWFHGDTLYGALRAMACITDIYAALGLYLAAKKYALAMAALAAQAQTHPTASSSRWRCSPPPTWTTWPGPGSRPRNWRRSPARPTSAGRPTRATSNVTPT